MDLLRKLVFYLSWPIRIAVRYELERNEPLRAQRREREAEKIREIIRLLREHDTPQREQNLVVQLQRAAARSTAEYILGKLNTVPALYSQEAILDFAVEQSDIDANSAILEFGVFRGRSISHLASLVSCPIVGFDSFEGLPEVWRTGFGQGHFGLEELPEVPDHVSLVKGWFDESLPPFLQGFEHKIALLHVDCDLYSSTKTIFDMLGHLLEPGCIIVFDEYFNYPGWEEGEFKAFQEFVDAGQHRYEYLAYNALHEQVVVRLLPGA